MGSIGCNGAAIHLASGTTGIRVISDNTIRPCDASGAFKDNAIDLGAANARWKDLYLSGKVTSTRMVFAGGTSDATIFRNDANGSGLHFSAAAIMPANAAGTVSNGTEDLGSTSQRFKDLYLSGGVYLGGTGAANKLDDYEEGTWTGTLTGSSTAPSTAQTATGTYTKVGNLVTVNIEFSNKDVTGASGNAQITGLPFTCGDNVQGAGWNSRVGSSTDVKMAYISSDNNIVWLNGHGTSLAWTTVGTGTYTAVTITFMVA